MSDNYIVKGVAGTCITFSFILAGKLHTSARYRIEAQQPQETP
jgi:hypothetical protein